MRSRTLIPRRLFLLLLALLVAACAGDDSNDAPTTTVTAAVTTTEATAEAPSDDAPSADEPSEDAPSDGGTSGGAGSATLVVDGETWAFDEVICGFGPDEIGDPEAEFVLAAADDEGINLYVSVDGFGESIELADLDDMDDPRVSWFTQAEPGAGTIIVTGRQVSASATFIDDVTGAAAEGTLTGTCP